MAVHDTGPVWVANPSPYDSFIHNTSPVYPGAQETFAWYYDQAVANKEGNGHVVTIVGWDDTFPKTSFKITPPGDGAFIVRNTKGPLWGQKQRKKNLRGYFYVSYYDRMFMTKLDSLVGNHVFSRVDAASPYDRIYQHDLLGYNYPLAAARTASPPNTASFANVFKATSRYGELLKAASFYTLAEGVQYEVSVVTAFSGAGHPYLAVSSPPRAPWTCPATIQSTSPNLFALHRTHASL
jgi:C1A family cysteine protease